MAHCPPSNRAIHPSRSDIINRERCLRAQHGFAASLRARGNVRRVPHGATPGSCAAKKARLENSAANRALRPPRRCVERDKVPDSSARKPPASSRPTISSGNSSCWVCLPLSENSREIDVQCGAPFQVHALFPRRLAVDPRFERIVA